MTGLLAHGLVQRANLPLPESLFFFAGAVVLAVSFAALGVLWSRPRLEHDDWRPLPYGIGRALGSRPVEIACGALGFFLLVVTIVAGYVGPVDALSNFTPVFVLIIFWVGMAFASVLFGDVFHALNPWRAAARAVRLRGRRQYPEKLGLWPAAAGLFIFTWIELASGWGEHPARLATAMRASTASSPGSGWRSTASRRGRAAARPSASTSTCSRACRSSRSAAGRSAGGRCWAGCRRSSARREPSPSSA